ncbi:MAG: ABC transporter ATP-binding protein [Bacillota bacterium]
MIRLENVVKKYPHMERPAVKNLSMEINKGEICVFVGPSGCGKTTTLKMFHLLIRPAGGKIYINGKDVQNQDPDKLRQNIGYVIQQIGLFPHMTVYNNIATVPRLLGWEEKRIKERVDELLDLMGLYPNENRDKYPNALSGGQRQRVGVARAMAADPPIMLMDEPFGAVDPIVRAQLQNEFLRLQEKIKKTICFVTHDIDEAIKMGDKIAIMRSGELIQFDTPENILFAPANPFVEEFVGFDRALKVLNLLDVRTVMKKKLVTTNKNDSWEGVTQKFKEHRSSFLVVTDDRVRILGYVNRQEMETHTDRRWQERIRSFSTTLPLNATLKDALAEMLQHDVAVIPIVDDDNELTGIVSMEDLRSYIGEAYEDEENDDTPVIKVTGRRGA